MPKTYAIKANRTPQDVLADNDITLEIGYSIEEARIASIAIQKTGEFVAVWIEEEVKASPRPEPRIVRRVESDRTGVKYNVVYCDNWPV
jgi:hypothetical protein